MRRAVLLLALALSGCGVTPWQREQDARVAAYNHLTSPAMEAAIAAARQ